MQAGTTGDVAVNINSPIWHNNTGAVPTDDWAITLGSTLVAYSSSLNGWGLPAHGAYVADGSTTPITPPGSAAPGDYVLSNQNSPKYAGAFPVAAGLPSTVTASRTGRAGDEGDYSLASDVDPNGNRSYPRDAGYKFLYFAGGQWRLGDSVGYAYPDYTNSSSDPTTFPLTGWVVGAVGSSPAPIFTAGSTSNPTPPATGTSGRILRPHGQMW